MKPPHTPRYLKCLLTVLTLSSPALSCLAVGPVISSIPAQLTQMNAPTAPIPFTVTDPDTPVTSLILSANSSNPTLVPAANIALGGTGTNRTVTITPAQLFYGVATITLSVSDGTETNGSSFDLTVNSPPQLQANNRLTCPQGGSATITTLFLSAADPESGPNQVIFTVAPGGNGGAGYNGALRVNGTNLVAGSSFTQADIESGRVSYQHNGNCEANDDFQFNVTDGMGGTTPTGQYLTYSFAISILLEDRAPIAIDGWGSVPLNAPIRGSLTATNPDCLSQALTYRILTNGFKGTLVLTNTHTGGFVYTPNQGEIGQDRVVFQVNDGVQDAVTPGACTLIVTNQSPVASGAQFFTAAENTVFKASLTASDPDLPAQTLTYSVLADGAKGTVTFPNPANGTFTYTPKPGRFGLDFFTYKVNDGSLDSAPASVMLLMRPVLVPGRLLVSDRGKSGSTGSASPMIGLIDAQTGDQGLLTMADKLQEPACLAVETSGTVLVTDTKTGLIRVNPATGAQVLVAGPPDLQTPFGIAVEADGNLALIDAKLGPMRLNSAGQRLSLFPKGNLQYPGGLVLAPNGDWLITDAATFVGNPAGNDVIKLETANTNQTVLSAQGYLALPLSIAREPTGTLLVANAGGLAGGPDNVIRINPQDGTQSILASSNLLSKTTGVAVNPQGEIFTANGNGLTVKIDPVTGAQTQVGAVGVFSFLMGIAVVPGSLPPPAMLSVTSVTDGFLIRVAGTPGRTCELMRSPAANETAWTSLGTQPVPISGVVEFKDQAPVAGSAFYRARMQ